MNRPASALEQLLRSNTTHQKMLKAPEFTGDGNVEIFIQQLQEVAIANDWSKMATLLHIRAHLKHNAHECEIYATLMEVFESLRFKYELTIRKSKTQLTSLKRDQTLFD